MRISWINAPDGRVIDSRQGLTRVGLVEQMNAWLALTGEDDLIVVEDDRAEWTGTGLHEEALTTCPLGIPHTIHPIAPGVWGTPPTPMAGPDGPLDPLGGPIPGVGGSHLPEHIL